MSPLFNLKINYYEYGFNIQTNNEVWRISYEGVRKATPEEIKVVIKTELELSTITLKYIEGYDSLSYKYGIVSFKDVEKLFDLMNSVIGF